MIVLDAGDLSEFFAFELEQVFVFVVFYQLEQFGLQFDGFYFDGEAVFLGGGIELFPRVVDELVAVMGEQIFAKSVLWSFKLIEQLELQIAEALLGHSAPRAHIVFAAIGAYFGLEEVEWSEADLVALVADKRLFFIIFNE